MAKTDSVRTWLGIAWVQAIAAMAGSLYFSDIKHWTPCDLCWYQRIFMYPLVIILGIAWFKRDAKIAYYVLPLVLIGPIISLYHYLLQWGVFEEGVCRASAVSCAYVPNKWFGFVTLPLLALVAFLVIAFCMWMVLRQSKGK